MIVVRISFALKRVFSHAANSAQSAPPAIPQSKTAGKAQKLSISVILTAKALAAKPPINS
jgi:hypothetical protein